MKKRLFMLLEVLLALALVALCAIPLIMRPIQTFRDEMKSLEEGEGERLADWTFSEIKELLLKNGIPWEKLPGLHATAGPFSLEPKDIQVPGRKTKKIARSYTLYGQGEKEGEGGKLYRLLYVHIRFAPGLSMKKSPVYTYRLPVQRIAKEV